MDAPKLPLPVLMLVTDRKQMLGEDNLVRCVRDAVANGVNVIQLREKGLTDTDLAALANRVVDAISGRAILIVNTAIDVARRVGASGVHYPENTRIAGDTSGLIIGRSVHSLASAQRAVEEGANYLIVGPVFNTKTHNEATPVGWSLVRDVANSCPVPVIAIGGLTTVRIPRVIQAGASGVAAIRGLREGPAVARMRAVLDREFVLKSDLPA